MMRRERENIELPKRKDEPESLALKIFLTVLLALGVGIAFYTWTVEDLLERGLDPGGLCGAVEFWRCDVVLTSAFAKWFGVPLACYALLFYGMLLADLWWVKPQALRRTLFCYGVGLAVVASLGLFLITRFVLKAICPLCYSLYAVQLALLMTIVWVWRPLLPTFQTFWKNFPRLRWMLVGSFFCFLLFVWLGYPRAPRSATIETPVAREPITTAQEKEVAPLAVKSLVPPAKQETEKKPKETRRREVPSSKPQSVKKSEIAVKAEGYYAEIKQMGRVDLSVGACSPLYGTPKAPIKLWDFSDFQCPWCRKMSYTIKEMVEEFGDKLYVEYCHYPLDSKCNRTVSREIHPFSCELAAIAECARDRGMFPVVVEEIFLYQANIPYWLEGKIPGGVGPTSFRGCSKGPAIQERLQKHIALSERYNIETTPTLFMNGLRVGNVPAPVLRELILLELAEKKQR